MAGSFETYTEFESKHIIGNPGDTYLVGGRLLAWNETTKIWEDLGSLKGPTGQSGPQGEKGPIAATIPFAISSGSSGEGFDIACDEEGKPTILCFAGFGSSNNYYPVRIDPGDWDAGIIQIDRETAYPNTFIMPYDGILKCAHVLFANRHELYIETGTTMRPFMCLAVSDGSSLAFTVLRDTMTFTEPYVGESGTEIPKYSLRKGSLPNLNTPIAEGTLVGIVAGWLGSGTTESMQAQFSISGGLFIE